MDVRIVIIYSSESVSIEVNGDKMEDISYIENNHNNISAWFEPSNGRDGWEGLAKEIRKLVGDDSANLNFEFNGAKEYKDIFEKTINRYGFGQNADGMSNKDITDNAFKEALKYEHQGLLKKAFDSYLRAADYGNSVEAQFKVAEYYYNHYNGEDNGVPIGGEDALAKAIKYYEKAGYAENKEAKYKLYEIFSKEDGLNRDVAIQWLTSLAQQGDIKAQIELGDKYRDGVFVSADAKVAYNWYKEAADQDDAVAKNRIGILYISGALGEVDYQKAFEWYTKSAEQGDASAQNNLASMYNVGYLGEPDYEKAFEWYTKSAEQGYANAQNSLGYLYASGNLGNPNYEKACEWYMKAAEQGHSGAQFSLGFLNEQGDMGKPNYAEACKWYSEAAEHGDMDAQYSLGWLYESGNLGEPNYAEACKWFSKAALQGHAEAQCDLGWLYKYGKVGEKNYTRALEWYNKSAEQGYSRAMYLIGLCYEFGTGVNKDMEVAFQWYKKAADADEPDKDACYKIAKAYDDQKDKHLLLRSGALVALSVLVPVTNFVTIPAGIAGVLGTSMNKIEKFIKSDAGKDMMKYYRKAAEFGHEKAKKKVKEYSTYEK